MEFVNSEFVQDGEVLPALYRGMRENSVVDDYVNMTLVDIVTGKR